MVKGILASEMVRLGVDHAAILNKDFAPGGGGQDLQQERMAAEALHLDDVLEAHLAEHAAKTLFGLPSSQLMQGGENAFQAFDGAGFLQEQLRASRQGSGAVLLRGEGGHHHLLNIRVFAPDQVEQLQAVHHRHFDINDREVDGLVLNQGEGLAGVLGQENVPAVPAPLHGHTVDHLPVGGIVIDEQNFTMF